MLSMFKVKLNRGILKVFWDIVYKTGYEYNMSFMW
jgi:hypothetical protein